MPKKIQMYSDGACRGNPGPGGWGVLLIYNDTEKEIYGNNDLNKISVQIDKDIRSAIGESVKLISKHLNIDAIVVMTESGSTAIIVSHYRPDTNIFALTPNKNICNK